MKVASVVIILIAVTVGAIYFGPPVLIEKKTSGLRTDIQYLEQKLQKTDMCLPAAINRIDLLCHEMSKLSGKG